MLSMLVTARYYGVVLLVAGVAGKVELAKTIEEDVNRGEKKIRVRSVFIFYGIIMINRNPFSI